MEKGNTVKDFDFTEDSGVAKTPEEMKIALDSVQTLLKEEVKHISWGGGTKQELRVDYIDIDWHYTASRRARNMNSADILAERNSQRKCNEGTDKACDKNGQERCKGDQET